MGLGLVSKPKSKIFIYFYHRGQRRYFFIFLIILIFLTQPVFGIYLFFICRRADFRYLFIFYWPPARRYFFNFFNYFNFFGSHFRHLFFRWGGLDEQQASLSCLLMTSGLSQTARVPHRSLTFHKGLQILLHISLYFMVFRGPKTCFFTKDFHCS